MTDFLNPLVILMTVGRKNLTSTWMSTRSFAGATNDEFTICHNRMDFPQEIGNQDDKMKVDFYFDALSTTCGIFVNQFCSTIVDKAFRSCFEFIVR